MTCLNHFVFTVGFCFFAGFVAAGEPDRKAPDDPRLGAPRTLRDAYHPWQPPESKTAWEREAERIRERVLVSNGLWPMPPQNEIKPVIHGRIERDDYTVEKVFFESHPGHYVTGNLYRPQKVDGKAAGVLCPHGHWPNGRFYDAGEKKAREQIEKGAETFPSGARFPVQARMVQLARMGCVVFHYDMVGYADSKEIKHREGFTDVEAGLRLQNFMGLQTFNSIRALDFLLSLPEVDKDRIGVTGSSGGGTQTFMLGAVDDRPAVAFPAVMVSTAMQGGCVCENAEYLRVGVNNIAVAALFAPKPMAMSGADDWTIDIETKGLPELKKVYGFYDKADDVTARAWPEFKHNYNQRAREMMYAWFKRHLDLEKNASVQERNFEPVPPDELSVFDDKHARPENAKDAASLREYLTATSKEQFAELLPETIQDVAEYRRVVGTAARVMYDSDLPSADEVEAGTPPSPPTGGKYETTFSLVRRVGEGENEIPTVIVTPRGFKEGTVVLWIDPQGTRRLFDKSKKPRPAVQELLVAGMAVAACDVFLTGSYAGEAGTGAHPKVDATYQGYTFGYNRPALANRVRDVLTVIAALRKTTAKSVRLVGTGGAGPWVMLAAGPARDAVDRVVADVDGFDFGDVESTSDPMFLPGALRYGGLGGLAALAAPTPMVLYGSEDVDADEMRGLVRLYEVTEGTLAREKGVPADEAILGSVLSVLR